MKRLMTSIAALACLGGAVSAQSVSSPAYLPDWNGGPPLPALGSSSETSYQATPPARMKSSKEQPAGLSAIQIPVIPGDDPVPPAAVPPAVIEPTVVATTPKEVTVATPPAVIETTVSGPPAVLGPGFAKCIVRILNGERKGGLCSDVRIPPGDIPFLRQKFADYRPNVGYVLNLPTDDMYRVGSN